MRIIIVLVLACNLIACANGSDAFLYDDFEGYSSDVKNLLTKYLNQSTDGYGENQVLIESGTLISNFQYKPFREETLIQNASMLYKVYYKKGRIEILIYRDNDHSNVIESHISFQGELLCDSGGASNNWRIFRDQTKNGELFMVQSLSSGTEGIYHSIKIRKSLSSNELENCLESADLFSDYN